MEKLWSKVGNLFHMQKVLVSIIGLPVYKDQALDDGKNVALNHEHLFPFILDKFVLNRHPVLAPSCTEPQLPELDQTT